ncbi:MAG: OmpA family protein [Flavobacteriaceae bacterium]
MRKIITSLCLVLAGATVFAQETKSPWSFEFGVNAVDVYPIGEDMPYGDYFDEFFNLNDHWNMGGFFVGATYDLTKHFSISARGTSNELSKWGDVYGDESYLVDNLKYYSLDGAINFQFTTTRLRPYIAVGGGYTWIEEGPYNTFSLADGDDNLVGAGTVNGAIGAKYQLSDHFALNLQFMYKHTFEDYLTKHWQHSLGVVYSVGNKSNKKEKVVVDTDGDGIPDEYDFCPEVNGLKQFGGCPKPEEKVVEKVVETKEVVKEVKQIPTTQTIYFDYDSAKIDNNAQVILDGLANALQGNNSYNVQIDGNADSIGSDSYNKSLSSKRAEAVKQYLVSKGLSNSAISTMGLGEDKPASNNNTKEGRALNRRADLTIKVKF